MLEDTGDLQSKTQFRIMGKYIFAIFIFVNLLLCWILSSYYPATGGYFVIPGRRRNIEFVLNGVMLLEIFIVIRQYSSSLIISIVGSVLLHIAAFVLSTFIFSMRGIQFDNIYIIRYFFLYLLSILMLFGFSLLRYKKQVNRKVQ